MSYTETNPVPFNLRCDTCKGDISASNFPSELLAIWGEAHKGHIVTGAVPVPPGTPVTTSRPSNQAGSPVPGGTKSQQGSK